MKKQDDLPRPKVPISVCLIAKNERKRLPKFNRNMRQILALSQDEIVLVDTGSTDGTPKKARAMGWKVIERPDLCTLDLAEHAQRWLPGHWEQWHDHPHMHQGIMRDFAAARQISFDAAQNEVCFWLDLDDKIVNPQYLRPFIDQCYAPSGERVPERRGVLFLKYHYARDKDDDFCLTELWRERVVTRADFHWKGRCHETLIPRSDQQGMFMARDPNFPCYIDHVDPKVHQFSDLRNYVILKHELTEQSNDWDDPRTMYYLGNACRGLGEHDEALEWYGKFVRCSGSRDDIFAARISMANTWAAKGRPWRAMQEAFEAQRTLPQDPRGHYMIATLWFKLEHWKNCLTWVRLGDVLPSVDTLHALDPMSLNFQPAAMGAISARELHMPDLAVEFAERAVRERPNLPAARASLSDFQQWAEAEKLGQCIRHAVAYATDATEALKHLQVPPHMGQFGLGVPEGKVPGDGKKPNLAFWCGTSAEPWGPNPEQTGIGASEKMVMELAKRLVGKFNVTVYCSLNCDEGEYDGVNWRYSAHFNPHLYRDHLVIWRMPQVLEQFNVRAGRIYVWMHDVGSNAVWNERILARVDRVLFLSEFHRSLHPAVPDEKVYLTRNGIDLERHLYDGTEKEKKIVFMSSPERGYKTAIRVFKDSGLAQDGWELHMLYGFAGTWRKISTDREYGHLPDEQADRRMLEYEDECLALCEETPGVVNRGRLSWNETAKELQSAAIWLYPTKFDEISCVAAMEAMAAGCKVVATDHAALKETLQNYPGWSCIDTWKPTLQAHCLAVSAVDEHHPGPWAEHARRFDINVLAQTWAEELFLPSDEEEDESDTGSERAA